MATWITHLRIAENLLEQIPGLDVEKFALGSVGPDSGKPDEKWKKFTPDSAITHFGRYSDAKRELADLEFYQNYLLPLRSAPDPDLVSFRLGYFSHLLTDNLWSEKIGRPTQRRWAEQFAADKDFIWEVKKDWYGLDFIHLSDHTDCFWSVFRAARPYPGGLEFLVPESLAWSVDHIQQYYQKNGEEIRVLFDRPYIYLSQAEVDCFVEETTRYLSRIYQHLWINGFSTDGFISALDLAI